MFKIDSIYENPVLDIFVSGTFNFIIQVLASCLSTDHEIHKNYNLTVNNFRASNFMKHYQTTEHVRELKSNKLYHIVINMLF